MDFVHINEKGEAVRLVVHVSKDVEHKEVYAHGATGGPTANYHFRIDFYKDVFPPLEYDVMGNEIQTGSVKGIERKILTSVYLPLPFLKELRNWLDKNVVIIEQEYGEIRLPKGDEEKASEQPKKKQA